MTVYIVLALEFDLSLPERIVLGVFSTREAAEEKLPEYEESYSFVDIEAHQVY